MSKLQWFKLYTEAAQDPKLNYLSDAEFRVWFKLLCTAAEVEEDRGIIKEDNFILSLKVANGDEELLNQTLEKLEKLKIVSLENEQIEFINFQKRQYENPSDVPQKVTERVKKHREMKRQCNDPVTSETTCNENETTLKRKETSETTRVDKSRVDKSRVDKSSSSTAVTENSEKQNKFSEIVDCYFQETGRTFSPADYECLKELTEDLPGPELPKRLFLIQSVIGNISKKKKGKGGSINSFNYFKEAILEEFKKHNGKKEVEKIEYNTNSKEPGYQGYRDIRELLNDGLEFKTEV